MLSTLRPNTSHEAEGWAEDNSRWLFYSDNGSDVSTLEMRVTMIMVIVKMVVILVLMSMSVMRSDSCSADPEVHSRLGPAIFCSQRCSLEPQLGRIRRKWIRFSSKASGAFIVFLDVFGSFWVTGEMIRNLSLSPLRLLSPWIGIEVMAPVPVLPCWRVWFSAVPGKKITKKINKKHDLCFILFFFCAFSRTLGEEGALVPQTWQLDLNRS